MKGKGLGYGDTSKALGGGGGDGKELSLPTAHQSRFLPKHLQVCK